jgi:hypothetical protein
MPKRKLASLQKEDCHTLALTRIEDAAQLAPQLAPPLTTNGPEEHCIVVRDLKGHVCGYGWIPNIYSKMAWHLCHGKLSHCALIYGSKHLLDVFLANVHRL